MGAALLFSFTIAVVAFCTRVHTVVPSTPGDVEGPGPEASA